MSRANIAEANDIDAQNAMVQGVIGTVSETVLGVVTGSTEVGGAVLDQAVGETLGRADGQGWFLPTDNELKAWEERWHGENREILVQRYQLLKTLDEEGRLQLPPDVSSVEEFMTRERDIRLATILDSTGQTLVVHGKPVTAGDWSEKFDYFTFRNSQVEKEN